MGMIIHFMYNNCIIDKDLMNQMQITEEHLVGYINQIFQRYDVDQSGALDTKELTFFFNDINRLMGKPSIVTINQTQQALAMIDRNHDGRISREELFYAFKGILEKEGFYIQDQKIWMSTGCNYGQAHQQWNMTQQKGTNLPYFGNSNQPTAFGVQQVMRWIMVNHMNSPQQIQQLIKMEADRRVQILLQLNKITLFDVPQAEGQIMREVEKELQIEMMKLNQQQQLQQPPQNYGNH